jgi:hypothetical protein
LEGDCRGIKLDLQLLDHREATATTEIATNKAFTAFTIPFREKVITINRRKQRVVGEIFQLACLIGLKVASKSTVILATICSLYIPIS